MGRHGATNFDKPKKKLMGSEVLTHYDDKLPIMVSADASPIEIGAVLAHEMPDSSEKTIEYSSKTLNETLNETQRNYSQLEREALALIKATEHFHQYLAGRKFKLITDHKPLLGIFNQKSKRSQTLSLKLERYKRTLSAYEYELIHRPEKKHGNVDMLSRFPLPEEATEDEEVANVLMLEGITRNPISAEEIRQETEKDKTLKQIKTYMKKGWPKKTSRIVKNFWVKRNELTIQEGCIVRGDRIVVPKTFRREILKYLHLNHSGIVATKAYARSYAWWPGIDEDIEALINNCDRCQDNRNNPPRAPVKNWEIPENPWTRIHIDFAGPFQGQSFLIVADATSKWIEVSSYITVSKKVIEELRRIFATFGTPEMLVSDNGTPFKSAEMAEFAKRNGIEQIFVAPYHPAANGLAEKAVQTTTKKFQDIDRKKLGRKTEQISFEAAYNAIDNYGINSSGNNENQKSHSI
ncbi:uncharacterized protein K02A2.6-like [Diprion similis]|uniref:uncharacterized protein K02A2.6-like n=1 Tax=Diprion similis TaxID=362088 RepID=UPI001EF937DD|nr:uncharacterized protein K02A2.6-like [Diprion similis]